MSLANVYQKKTSEKRFFGVLNFPVEQKIEFHMYSHEDLKTFQVLNVFSSRKSMFYMKIF